MWLNDRRCNLLTKDVVGAAAGVVTSELAGDAVKNELDKRNKAK